MEKNLDITNPRYNEPISPAPWHFVKSWFHCTVKMSLFQFGFSISSTRQQTPHEAENIALAATHLPDQGNTILGRNEYNQVAAALVDLARPQPSQSRSKRSKHHQYSGEDRAKIAKYSCEHGNKKALQHFSKEYPKLKESTLRNFKKAYQDKLLIQRQQGNVQQVTSLERLPHGHPPLLLELDCKLISFVKISEPEEEW